MSTQPKSMPGLYGYLSMLVIFATLIGPAIF
jgi:hypothetical protein